MGTPLRLLMLEDNPADAELALNALRRAGYDPIADRVETEQDYRDHLQPAPEVILADFTMPEFDSMRALAILQECQLDIPFIIVSGTIGEERAVQVMQRGATDYIIKDRLARLGPAVDQALARRSGGTVPVGAVLPEVVTTAVKVTAAPTAAGFRLEVRVICVGSTDSTCPDNKITPGLLAALD